MAARVGLARGPATYGAAQAPWSPERVPPELVALLGDSAAGVSNPAYEGVRSALLALGLDANRCGTTEWSPLSDLVAPGATVVLKPNFIRHWNPLAEERSDATIASVITHGAIVRAAADYALLAVGRGGRVVIAEAPQQDCSWTEIREIAGLDAMVEFYRTVLDARLEVIDLRREAVRFEDAVIVERSALAGDPAGYRAVDLGERSFFRGSGLDPSRLRGADYDPGPTAEHHSGGRNAYLLSETVLACDLIVNLPKMKTHKKTGVTLALKNMVGINGDKNWLPHHSAGSEDEGGDEFPGRSFADVFRSRLSEIARQLLKRGLGTRLVQAYRRAEVATRGDDFIRSGNWHGNRTTWRMCADLNRCLYYSDASGAHLDEAAPVRTVLTVLDGIVAGEGNGPLAPRDVPLGAVLASTDPVALDLVAIRMMGFDERRIPKVWEPMRTSDLRVTRVSSTDDVEVGVVEVGLGADDGAGVAVRNEAAEGGVALRSLDEIDSKRPFLPHSGWLHHIERPADDAGDPPNAAQPLRTGEVSA